MRTPAVAYLLLYDGDDSLRSRTHPIGVVLASEDAAKKWVQKHKGASYEEVIVMSEEPNDWEIDQAWGVMRPNWIRPQVKR